MPGTDDLKLPDDLRPLVHQHLGELRQRFKTRGWGARVGFGERPALLVIDLGKMWTNPNTPAGADLHSVVYHTRRVLDAARQAGMPVFFTTMAYSPDDPDSPTHWKKPGSRQTLMAGSEGIEIDPRLGRRPTEKLIVKKYASCFKGTDLQDMLASLRVDTLIVTGCSTSHCVYATCRDAVSGYRVIVPEEAVGERCELSHLVFLLDIDMGLGDVLPTDEVLRHLASIATA